MPLAASQWLPQLIGVAIIGMSLITRYERRIAKIIPLNVQLGVDAISGALRAVSPRLIGFANLIW